MRGLNPNPEKCLRRVQDRGLSALVILVQLVLQGLSGDAQPPGRLALVAAGLVKGLEDHLLLDIGQ